MLIIGPVNDAPNQVRFQRVKALSERYQLHVVTTAPLPASLAEQVNGVHIVGRWLSMWTTSYKLARRLGAEYDVLVITTYAPRLVISGFLCHVTLGCRWVYDLYDHPSLTWGYERGFRRLTKQLLWGVGMAWMLRWADVWIIAMHPGILSHLPVPRAATRLVLVSGPGTARLSEAENAVPASDDREISICYAGPVKMKRGMDLVIAWAQRYEGPPACLHLMGEEDDEVVYAIEGIRSKVERRGLQIVRHGWTSHKKVLDILREGDIGICLLNPQVLNYRYAYPVKLVEYMSWGLVPVATDGQGVRALVRNGENGFVGRYDIDSFTQTMNKAICFIHSPDKKEALLRNARASVADRRWCNINERLLLDLETALSTVE